jgi:hypothetical protein
VANVFMSSTISVAERAGVLPTDRQRADDVLHRAAAEPSGRRGSRARISSSLRVLR